MDDQRSAELASLRPVGYLFAVVGVVAALPSVVVGGVVALALSRGEGRARATVAVAGLVGGLLLGVVGHPAGRLYAQGYLGVLRGHPWRLVDTLPVAVPLGCLLGAGAAEWRARRRRRSPKPVPLDRAPELAVDPELRVSTHRLRTGIVRRWVEMETQKAAPADDAAGTSPRPAPDAPGDGASRPSPEPPPEPPLVVARSRRQPVAVQDPHVSIIAPTGRGKTRGLIIPLLLEWPGPALVTSTKLDVVVGGDKAHPDARGTLGARLRRGPCWGFSLDQPDRLYQHVPRLPWDPLWRVRRSRDHASSLNEAAQLAQWLDDAYAKAGGSGATTSDPMWSTLARDVVRAALLAAASAQEGIASVAARIDRLLVGDQAVEGELERFGLHRNQAPETWQGILASAKAMMTPWQGFPDLGPASPWDPQRLIEANGTVYVLSEAGSAQRACYSVFVLDLVKSLQAAGHLSPRCLVALDETANIAPLPNLTALLTASREVARVVTVWQSRGQLVDIYGEQAANVVGQNSAAIYLPGGDASDTEHLLKLLGEVRRRHEQVSQAPGRWRKQTTGHSVSEGQESLTTASELRALPRDALFLATSAHGVSLLRLRFWDRDRTLRSLGRLDPALVARSLAAGGEAEWAWASPLLSAEDVSRMAADAALPSGVRLAALDDPRCDRKTLAAVARRADDHPAVRRTAFAALADALADELEAAEEGTPPPWPAALAEEVEALFASVDEHSAAGVRKVFRIAASLASGERLTPAAGADLVAVVDGVHPLAGAGDAALPWAAVEDLLGSILEWIAKQAEHAQGVEQTPAEPGDLAVPGPLPAGVYGLRLLGTETA